MAKKKSMTQLGNELAEDHLKPSSEEDTRGDYRLTHDENLRGTALSLACRYYVETIVKDGDLYREMVRDNKVLKPATYVGVLDVAFAFEAFLSGELKKATQDLLQATDLEELTEEDRAIPSEEQKSDG
jgi:hypothetical protein